MRFTKHPDLWQIGKWKVYISPCFRLLLFPDFVHGQFPAEVRYKAWPSLPIPGKFWSPLPTAELLVGLAEAVIEHIVACLQPLPSSASFPLLSQLLIPRALLNKHSTCYSMSEAVSKKPTQCYHISHGGCVMIGY